MQYMLIHLETTNEVARKDDPKESAAYWGAWTAYVQEIYASGIVKSGNVLQPPNTATTLRIEGGNGTCKTGPTLTRKNTSPATSSSTCLTSTSRFNGPRRRLV